VWESGVLVRGLRLLSAVLTLLVGAVAAQAETITYSTRPATNLRTGGTDALTFGAAPTLLTVTTRGSGTGTNNTNGASGVPSPALTITGPAPPTNTAQMINSVINGNIDDETVSNTVTITFTEPVYNVSVVVGDIDGGPNFSSSGAQFNDIVEFRAQAANATTIATLPTSGTTATANVTWVPATGRALATGATCPNTGAGSTNCNATATFAGPVRVITVRHIAGVHNLTNDPTEQYVKIDSVTFTRSPLLRVNKQALGSTGSFPLAVNNILNTGTTPWSGTSASQTLAVSPAGATTTGTQRILWQTNVNTVITETIPVGWAFSGSTMACTDSNFTASGNPASFTASVSLNTVVVANTNIRPGAIITCTVVNTAAIQSASIVKSWAFATPSGDVNGNGLADVGDQIVYSYLVENTGNVTLTNVVVNDIHEGTALPITPSRVVTDETLILNGPSGPSTDGGTNGSWDTLTPGSRVRFRYTHTVNLAEFNAG
jgi:hypothetical protein